MCMFGYVIADLGRLTEAQRLRYHSVYCGLCRALYADYGAAGALALLDMQSGADFRPQLMLLAGDAAEAFERLPIVQDAALLQNILYSGVWTRFDAAFRTKQEEPT